MGRGPKRRYEMVVDPDLRESYSKWPCANFGVFSPMILIDALLAETVPSEPSPKKIARCTSAGSMSYSVSQASEE
jgi:hypothetical protein